VLVVEQVSQATAGYLGEATCRFVIGRALKLIAHTMRFANPLARHRATSSNRRAG
jgi:hypothetical protein